MPRLLRAPALLFAVVLSARVFAADSPPALLTPPPPPAGTALPEATIIAKVENRIITLGDVRREVELRVDYIRKNAANEREFYRDLAALQNDMLNELINRALVLIDFQKDGKRKVPASVIDEDIDRQIHSTKYNGDRLKFLADLKNNGMSPRDYRKNEEENLIYEYMLGQQRRSETVISPAKVEAYYNAHKDKYQQEDAVRLRLITFTRAEGMDDAQLLARVQSVLARLKAGEKFETLARELTDVQAHRAKGGDLGWTKKTELKPEFATPAFTLDKGEIGGPIVTPEAAFLMLIEDRRAAGLQPLAEVSGEIQKDLATQLGLEAQARYIARLRANAYIRVYEPAAAEPAPGRP
ncbi:MAG: peptidyl-prolyl cis-trans isomerase [Verrucomicrobiota bacterium]